MTKLEQRMSDKERDELAAFGERFMYMPDHGTKSYDGKEDIIDAIQTGILSRKIVRYRYADARGRGRAGFMAPFGMVLYRHGLYAIAARLEDAKDDVTNASLAIFAVERFTEADLLEQVFRAVPIGVKGAFDYGLKSIAKAMHAAGLIETRWDDDSLDGLAAMVGVMRAAHGSEALGTSPLVQRIAKYNETDCRVVAELLHYLRANR